MTHKVSAPTLVEPLSTVAADESTRNTVDLLEKAYNNLTEGKSSRGAAEVLLVKK